MTTPQHDDPFGEATAKVLQALAVLTTVGESVARFAAAGAQSKAAKAEQRANLERAADAARQEADRAAQRAYDTQRRADRHLMDLAFNDDWLNNADIEAAANLWRTADVYGLSGDRRAAEVMRRAQERLAILNPGLVDAYERHRSAGLPLADAMKAATQEVWRHQTRPSPPPPSHDVGNPTSADQASPTGKLPVDDLSAATYAEVYRLAGGVDVELLEQLARQWQAAGRVRAAHAASELARFSRDVRDSPASPGPGGSERQAHWQVGRDGAVDPVPTPPPQARPDAQATDDVREATAANLARRADQQLRRASADRAQPDLPSTPADEHGDGLTAGHARHGRAENDQAAAAQLRRFGQTFPPLTSLVPTFSHSPAQPPASAATRRRGSTR